jgi:hypothetical protein
MTQNLEHTFSVMSIASTTTPPQTQNPKPNTQKVCRRPDLTQKSFLGSFLGQPPIVWVYPTQTEGAILVQVKRFVRKMNYSAPNEVTAARGEQHGSIAEVSAAVPSYRVPRRSRSYFVWCHARHWSLPPADGEPERQERRDCASPVADGGKHNGGHGRAGAFSNGLSTLLFTDRR